MNSDPSAGRRRTILLSIVVVLAVIVLGLVGFLVFGTSTSSNNGTQQSPGTTATTTTSSSDTSSMSPTKAPTSTPPSEHVAPGSVTYRLSGSGDVVALGYRDSSGRVLVAATSIPWSQDASVSDRDVELTAVVVRGPVTCTIVQGDKVISKKTSHGGPLRCAGKLPN